MVILNKHIREPQFSQLESISRLIPIFSAQSVLKNNLNFERNFQDAVLI